MKAHEYVELYNQELAKLKDAGEIRPVFKALNKMMTVMIDEMESIHRIRGGSYFSIYKEFDEKWRAISRIDKRFDPDGFMHLVLGCMSALDIHRTIISAPNEPFSIRMKAFLKRINEEKGYYGAGDPTSNS